MKILEKYINSKTGGMSTCEDGLFISDDFVAVVDGATSKNSVKVNGKSSGYYIKEIILESLKTLKFDSNANDAINYINDKIKKSKENLPKEFKMVAGVIIYSVNRKEIWNFGDCQCLINKIEHFHEKKIDILTSNLRSEYTKILFDLGYTKEYLLENDLGRESILPILKDQDRLINNSEQKYGYSCLNGSKINENDIIIYKLKENDEVVLSSDGYPHLKNSLEESEKYLQEVLIEDPLFIEKYKSTKGLKKGNISFDDRTYIRFIC